MSDQNTTITATGLSRMLHQFQGSTNLRKLASSYLDQLQAFEDAIWPLLGERALASATGHRLDGIGQILGLTRAGRSDTNYRAALTAEVAVLNSDGTAEDLLSVAQALVQMGTADYELADYYPKTVYIRPVDHALTQDPDFVANTLRRAASAATELLFVYALQADASTFTLSSQGATVETSSALGLAAVPTFEGWDFDTAIVLAGLGAGEFRFNNAEPADATQIFIHDQDSGLTDQSALLASLTGEVIHLDGSGPNAVGAYVSGVTDNTGTFTLDITNIVKTGGTFSDAEGVNLWSGTDGGQLAGAA